MEDLLRKQIAKELVVAAVASFLIFQASFVFYLFIVPVLYIGRKRGALAAAVLGFVVLAAVGIQLIVKIGALEGSGLRGFVITYGLSYPVALLTGALVIAFFQGRSLYKIIASTVLFTVVSIPVILMYTGNSQVVDFLKDQVSYATKLLLNGDESFSALGIKPGEITLMVRDIAFRDFIAAYFFLLSGCWYLSDLFVTRKNRDKKFDTERFTIPDWSVWVLIAALAGVLADYLLSLGWLGYISWNVTLIMLLLYGIKGAGLIKYFLRKKEFARRKQRSIVMLIFLLFLIPGLNLVVLLGIPGLGVSEIWVRYR